MPDIHDYERCDKWAWKTRCPAEAIIFEKKGNQWCKNHAPPLSPDMLRALHVLRDAGILQG